MAKKLFVSAGLTAGQLNDIVEKLGGHDEALRFLRDEIVVAPKVKKQGSSPSVKPTLGINGVFFTLAKAPTTNVTGWTCVESEEDKGGLFEVVFQPITCQGLWSPDAIRVETEKRTGPRHAEAMLKEPDKIPMTLRDGRFLVFPEVWKTKTGERSIPGVFYLSYSVEAWRLVFQRLNKVFPPNSQLVLRK
jgi:hypothetical protein